MSESRRSWWVVSETRGALLEARPLVVHVDHLDDNLGAARPRRRTSAVGADYEEAVPRGGLAIEGLGRFDDAAVRVDLEAAAVAQAVAHGGVVGLVVVAGVDAQHHGADVVVLDQLGAVRRIAEVRRVVVDVDDADPQSLDALARLRAAVAAHDADVVGRPRLAVERRGRHQLVLVAVVTRRHRLQPEVAVADDAVDLSGAAAVAVRHNHVRDESPGLGVLRRDRDAGVSGQRVSARSRPGAAPGGSVPRLRVSSSHFLPPVRARGPRPGAERRSRQPAGCSASISTAIVDITLCPGPVLPLVSHFERTPAGVSGQRVDADLRSVVVRVRDADADGHRRRHRLGSEVARHDDQLVARPLLVVDRADDVHVAARVGHGEQVPERGQETAVGSLMLAVYDCPVLDEFYLN